MKTNVLTFQFLFLLIILSISGCSQKAQDGRWSVSKKEYLEKQGLTVLAFHDFYPGGKQGGIEIIQHGERIATNGFIRMQAVNGRKFNDPEKAVREIDEKNQSIKSTVEYKDFDFKYSVRIWPEGDNIHLAVDLDKPIPAEWANKLSFDMEFYPPVYYGKSFQIGESFGTIPRLLNGTKIKDESGSLVPAPMGHGKSLTLAGEDPLRKIVINDLKGDLIMIDDRDDYYGGWIMLKSLVPSGATVNAIEWTITPNVVPD
jgi:endoglucanase